MLGFPNERIRVETTRCLLQATESFLISLCSELFTPSNFVFPTSSFSFSSFFKVFFPRNSVSDPLFELLWKKKAKMMV